MQYQGRVKQQHVSHDYLEAVLATVYHVNTCVQNVGTINCHKEYGYNMYMYKYSTYAICESSIMHVVYINMQM